MAKKSSKKKGSAKKALADADLKHYVETEKYVKLVDKLYQQAIAELAALAAKIDGIPEDKPFSFAHNKQIAQQVDDTIKRLASRITAVVEAGSRKEWTAACTKSDEFIGQIMNVSKLTRHTLQTYQDRNLEALAAFTQREVDGLDLSRRVWKYVAPIKDEVELAVDTTDKYYKHGINSQKTMTKVERAIGTGMSAQKLSQEVRSCLIEPKKLFRRVRDKYGNLHLSKAAKLYHPGQGVYRSSYKNAMRLTRSEINMAYRQSDHLRWQQLDFVVGIKIELSNNHTCLSPKTGKPVPFYDICDELAGNYPKDFKFVGWHPQCRCHATPILKPLEEIGEGYVDNDGNYQELPASNEVKDVPQGFKDYIVANDERMKGWKSTPYYIKDNPQYIDKALHPEKYKVTALVLTPDVQERMKDFEIYGFNHSGSKKFNTALANAKQAILQGNQKAFDDAIAEMEAIRKKNEASTASKAAKKKAKEMTEEDIIAKMLADDLATFTPEQIANIHELEKLLKQKKGLRMTYEQADTGKENPNYAVFKATKKYVKDEDGHFVFKNGKAVINPEYTKLKGYTVNCQTCTVIHELRRRGFNVEAITNYRGKVWNIYKKQGVGSKHEGYRKGKWLDKDGNPVGYTYTHEWAAKNGKWVYNKSHVEEFFEEFSQGKDGRFEICVDWKGGSAHVFCAERKDGKWFFFDPQSTRKDMFDSYAADAKLHTFGIIRTDDKLINPKLFETFIPKGELPISVTGKTRAEQIAEIAQKRHDARTDEQKQKIQDFWNKRKADGKAFRKEMADVINSSGNIEDAKQSLKNLEDLMLGNKGAITTNAGKTATASMEKMRDAVKAVKQNVDAFNAAMADARKIAAELDGVKDIDTKTILKAKSIAEIKKQQQELEDIKQQILGLKNIVRPMDAAKDFTLSELKATDAAIEKTIGDWLKKYGYKSVDDNLEHAKAKLQMEVDQAVKNQSKYKTWKLAHEAYKSKLADVQTKIEWNEVGTEFSALSSAALKTPGFTSRIAKLNDAIVAKDLSKAHKIIADLKKEKAELDAIVKQMSDFGTYAATQKPNSKFGKLFAETQQALAADDLAKVKALLPQMADVKKTNEASVISHAKIKKFWEDAKAKLTEVKKNARPEDKDAVDALEKAIADKDKKAAEEALKKFKKTENTTKQMSEVSDSDVVAAGGKVEYTMQQLGVDRQTAQDYNDAVIGFSYQWDWEIRQVQMGNTTFTSHHGHSLEAIQKKADDIEKYIEASPKWNGGNTYRGVSVTKSQIQTWEGYITDGTEIDMKGTASWSTSRDVSSGFSGMHIGEKDAKGDVMSEKALFVCEEPQYGTSIRHLSRFSGEREILCSNRCRWKIVEHKFENGFHVFKVKPV